MTLAGAFWFDIGLGFAIVKINRVRFLYPVQAVLLVLRGTPILVQLMLTYYGIPLVLRGLNQEYGLDWNINLFLQLSSITAFAFNEAAYMSESIRAAIQAVSPGRLRQLVP